MADFTLDSVVSCLKVISQGDSAPQARAKAESSLLKFEKQRGFIQACLSLMRPDVDISLRWVVLIYTKNAIKRIWDGDANITLQDKNEIRAKLVQMLFTETSPKLSENIPLTIAAIAQTDFPRKWKDLLPQLIEGIKRQPSNEGDLIISVSVYKTALLLVTQILSERTKFSQQQLIDILSPLFDSVVQSLMPLLGTASGSEAQQLPTHFWKAIKKGIKIVLTVTKENVLPISSGIVMLLMKALNDFMTLFFVSPMSEIGKLSVSIVVSTIDTISCVQAYDPKELLPSLGNLFGFIWNVLEKCVPVFASEKGLDEEMEKRISKVISSVLTYFLRTLSSTSSECAQIIDSFFTSERVTRLLTLVITQTIPITQSQLKKWQEDPESYLADLNDEQSVNACGERLLALLVEKGGSAARATLRQIVYQLLEKDIPSNPSSRDVLLRDCAYNVLVLQGAEILCDESESSLLGGHKKVNPEIIERMLVKHLIPDCDRDDLSIVRRRLCQLVGRWHTALPQDYVPLCYQMISALVENGDPITKLAAGLALIQLCNSNEVQATELVQDAQAIIPQLCKAALSIEREAVSAAVTLIDGVGAVAVAIATHIDFRELSATFEKEIINVWCSARNANLKSAVIHIMQNLVLSNPNVFPVVTSSLHRILLDSLSPQKLNSIHQDAIELLYHCLVKLNVITEDFCRYYPLIVRFLPNFILKSDAKPYVFLRVVMESANDFCKVILLYFIKAPQQLLQQMLEPFSLVVESCVARSELISYVVVSLWRIIDLTDDIPNVLSAPLLAITTAVVNNSEKFSDILLYDSCIGMLAIKKPNETMQLFSAIANGRQPIALFSDFLSSWIGLLENVNVDEYLIQPMMYRAAQVLLCCCFKNLGNEFLQRNFEAIITFIRNVLQTSVWPEVDLSKPVRATLEDAPLPIALNFTLQKSCETNDQLRSILLDIVNKGCAAEPEMKRVFENVRF